MALFLFVAAPELDALLLEVLLQGFNRKCGDQFLESLHSISPFLLIGLNPGF